MVFVARRQTVVFAWKSELLEDVDHGVFELESLFLVHRRWQVEPFDVSGDSGSHRDLFKSRVDFGEHVLADGNIPVVGLFGLALDLVVFSNERFQIEAEDVIVLWSSGVGSDRAVIVTETSHHDI